MRRRHFDAVLAAGGTGGHMFPAQVLAREFLRRGHGVALISDSRGLKFKSLFEGIECLEVPSATLAGRSLGGRISVIFKLLQGVIAARRALKRLNPAVVVGFGGYPSLPTLIAAMTLGIPTCLHEQNAVLGRVNRALSRFVKRMALSFEATKGIPAGREDRIIVTGNPVRPEIIEIGTRPYPSFDDSRYLNLLILGGSQGATVLSTVVPGAISTLSKALRRRLQVVQQCRQEDIARVDETYREFAVKATLATFIDDIPAALAAAHLVIARAGAGTVTELAVAGRPSLLVPLPTATDNHQLANAAELGEAGGAWIIEERDFGTATLAKKLQSLANNPDRLRNAAARARRAARPAAVQALANMAEQVAIAGGEVPEPYEAPRRRKTTMSLGGAASEGTAVRGHEL
jgi:UDP-N-acetylglucosamine--N-acetylmuramyl-(pentapeptide) pyrophosphoryl-undecaprenol N-acetylglucosamine transferase